MAVTTGKVRFSYLHVWQPQAPQGGGEAKYSVTLLIPKSDVNTINAINAEMEQARQNGISTQWGGKLPPVVKVPIYDGDGVRPSGEPFGEECKGCYVMTASCKNAPYVVDLNVQPIINQSEVYSGCYGRASINFFAYNQNGNKGIGCGLNGIQKIEDGETLSGGVSAAEAFGGSNTYGGSYPAGMQTMPAGMMQNGMQMQQQNQMTPQMQTMQQSQVPQPPQGYYQPQTTNVDPITGLPIVPGGVMGIN